MIYVQKEKLIALNFIVLVYAEISYSTCNINSNFVANLMIYIWLQVFSDFQQIHEEKNTIVVTNFMEFQ